MAPIPVETGLQDDAAPQVAMHIEWMMILFLLSSWSYVETWALNEKWFVSFFLLDFAQWTLGFLAVGLVTALLTRLLIRGTGRWNSGYSIAAIVILSLQAWPSAESTNRILTERLGPVIAGVVVALGVTALLAMVVRIARAFPQLRALFFIIAAFLTGAHYITVAQFLIEQSGRILTQTHADHGVAASAPGNDVVVVVLDAYGRNDVLESEFDFENSRFTDSLSEQGMGVVAGAKSNYSKTAMSVAALLDSRYPNVGRPDDATITRLRDIHSGDNALFRGLSKAGYETHLIENAWSFTRCGPEVDVCHRALANEIDSILFSRSPLATLRPALRTNPWVRRSVDQLTRAEELVSAPAVKPRLIYLHVLIPHAPYQLDENCRTESTPQFEDYVTTNPEEAERLKAAYVDQVLCVNSLVSDLVSAAPQDVLLFVTGDHGPGLMGSLPPLVDTSPREVTASRGILLAYRFPSDCETIPTQASLVRATGFFFRCLGLEYVGDANRSPWQDDRYFASPRSDGIRNVSVIENTDAVSLVP